MVTRIVTWATAVLLFAATLAWRFLTFTGFSNDHYVHLARAQQMRLGEWPVRDFVDPGLPLMYVVSLVGHAVGGPSLGTEFLIVAIAFAVGSVFTFLAASKLAGSIAIAFSMTLLQIAISPRTYGYPKVLLYAIAGWVIIALAERPTGRRIVLAAMLIAIAFLFRHDHGVYIGLACAAATALATRKEGANVVVRSVTALTAARPSCCCRGHCSCS